MWDGVRDGVRDGQTAAVSNWKMCNINLHNGIIANVTSTALIVCVRACFASSGQAHGEHIEGGRSRLSVHRTSGRIT